MRYLISILTLTIFLTLTIQSIGQVKAETKQNDLLNNLPLISNTHNGNYSFLVGDSNQTRSEKEQLRAEMARIQGFNQTSDQRSGTSFTGHGEAKKLYIDTQFRDCVRFAKAQTGISRSIGDGGRDGINTQEVKAGEIGVESGKIPHAFWVKEVKSTGVVVWEANWLVDKDGTHWIDERFVPYSDILGYIT